MTIIDTQYGGWLKVTPEHKDSAAHLYLQTPEHGASLSVLDARNAITLIAEQAGFTTEPTGSGMGIIIQFPESPAVQRRREELAAKFTGDVYDVVSDEIKYAVEFIIDGEKQRGELK